MVHSSFCSSRIAPTSRRTAASLGKMPRTSMRRLISPLTRSVELVECSLARWTGGGEAHNGEHAGFRVVHQSGQF
jgi:hypothetical protein